MRGLNALDGLARTLALPGNSKPIRLPSFPALERTAVMGFNVSASTNVSSSTTDGPTKVLVMRQAAYPVWMQIDYANVTMSLTRLVLSGPGNPFALSNDTYSATYNGNTYGTSTGITFAQANPNNYAIVRPIIGVDPATGPAEWLYCPNGFAFIVNSSVSVAAPVNISYEYWISPGEFATMGTVSISTIAVGLNITSRVMGLAGWYRIAAVDSGTSNSTVLASVTIMSVGATPTLSGSTVNIPSTAPSRVLFPIASPTEYINSTLPWSNTRVTAVSALFTNTTKALNKEGTVLWGRLAPEQVNVWTTAQSAVVNLHPAEKKFLPLEDGTYTFVMPSTDLATFYDYVSRIGVPTVRLDNDSLVNAGFFDDADGGTNLAVNIDWHLEFRTTSALFQIGMSRTPVEALHQAQCILLEAGFFYPNLDHKSLITRAISFAAKASPLLDVLGPVGAGISKGAKIADTIMSRRIVPPPPTHLHAQPARTRKQKQKQKKPKQQPARKPATKPKRKGGLDMYLESRGRK